jgi:hypothetical protein
MSPEKAVCIIEEESRWAPDPVWMYEERKILFANHNIEQRPSFT